MLPRCARLALVAAVAACGSNPSTPGDADVDAPYDGPRGPCWPVDMSTPGGSITLGTGKPFIAMPDEVETEYGPQGGFHVPVNALITSMMPGNPTDSLDPGNPRTRFRGYYVDTGAPMLTINCPIRIGYLPSATPGAYELASKTGVLFEVGLPESEIFGRMVRIEVEIIDSDGKYARDEKVVTCRPPPGWPTGGGI